nr:RCC1 domain-containing protein 1 isoform X2 [Anas platyrhynchos]
MTQQGHVHYVTVVPCVVPLHVVTAPRSPPSPSCVPPAAVPRPPSALAAGCGPGAAAQPGGGRRPGGVGAVGTGCGRCPSVCPRASPHRHGQLGHGGLESEQQPRLVEALAGVPMRAVAAGGWHSASISEGGDLYMWGWNESGQLALPSKAVAEEQEQDEDAGTGAAEPPPPPGSSRAPPSFPSRRSRPCWTCPRTWRLVPSAAGPGTRLQSHETASSTPGAGVNTGSWAMGTTPALTGPGAWSTWWQRGCGHRRWCAGPGTPTCASWSSEGHEAVPRPSLCACSKGRQRRALLLPHGAALGPWRSGRGWADTMGGFPPPGPQLRPRSCAAASGSWGCTSDKDRAGLHGFIKSLFVTAAVVLRVAYTYRCPAAPAPLGTGKVYRKKAGAEEPGPALSPPPPGLQGDAGGAFGHPNNHTNSRGYIHGYALFP